MVHPSVLAAALRTAGARAWLVHDFRGSNPVFAQLLGTRLFLTRRAFLLLCDGEAPRLLLSGVDATPEVADRLPGVVVERYTRWTEIEAWLRERVAPFGAAAMEYSPGGALPAASWVDGGTLDLVRAAGIEVTPSADLVQLAVATWGDAGLASHRAAMAHAVATKDLAFEHVRARVAAGERCTEREVQALILEQFERRGVVTADPPVVAVNAHSGDPHYVPSDGSSAEIGAGDWLLVDLWCREPHDAAVYADITWVAQVGGELPDARRAVFDVVARARDAVVADVRERASAGATVLGFELDRIARGVVEDAGHGAAFVHRTGHSLSPGDAVHGLGANLDDLETHDTRPLRPGLGFTVEPGVYLPEFGVRLEIDVYLGPNGPMVTSPVQTAPVLLHA